MKRRQLLHLALGLPALAAARQSLAWQQRHLVGFGTTLHLQAGHSDAEVLHRALDAAVQTLRDIEAQMSLFDPDSALNRLNRTGSLDEPPAHLLAVLRTAQAVSARSAGAFDVTVQPLWQLFDQARQAGRVPAAEEVARARALVGWRGLAVSPHRVALDRPGMGVTLNGIAQGYAADQVRAVLQAHGVRDALVDAGEYALAGHSPQGREWGLGVADPRQAQHTLARLPCMPGTAVATSADTPSRFTDDGRHHHLFDPRTGWSPTALAQVTVCAPRAVLADALTKVCFVAGPARIAALAQAWGVDVLWVDKQGRVGATPGLHLHLLN